MKTNQTVEKEISNTICNHTITTVIANSNTCFRLIILINKCVRNQTVCRNFSRFRKGRYSKGPAHRNFETTANMETTSDLNFCETNKTSNRLVGKFVSSSIVNLSRWNITLAEIQLLEKGWSFVPALEKMASQKRF